MTKVLFIIDKVVAATKTGKEEPMTSDDILLLLDNVTKIKNLIKLNYKIVLLDTNTTTLKKGLCIKRLNNICSLLEDILKIDNNNINFISNSVLEDYNTLPNPGGIYDYLIDFNYNLRESALVGLRNNVNIKNLTGITHFFNIEDLE